MRTALVLSAGGMFAAWQAGAWRALAARVRPDAVIGASAGALNGWAIAGGASPDELAAAWLDPSVADLIRWRAGLSLFDPAPLHRTAQMLVERFTPAIPFAATLVDAARLRLRLVRTAEMSAAHLAAACSFPLGFPPVRLEGRWYIDGGVLGALPLWAAAEMGCERVIALDALPYMPSRIVRSASRMVRRVGRTRAAPPQLAVTRLRPSVALGTLGDALFWNANNAARWLAQGEQDAALSITI